jgi:hypothetical protein
MNTRTWIGGNAIRATAAMSGCPNVSRMTSQRRLALMAAVPLWCGAAAAQPCAPEWHAFEAGGQIGVGLPLYALTMWNGDLVAGGIFSTAGGMWVYRIARWDGLQWHHFECESGGEIGVNGTVLALTVYDGNLIAGGQFTTAGGRTVNRIARWDGSQWHPLESGGQVGVSGTAVHVLTVYNGDLIAGGDFATAGGQTVNRLARWDGAAWHPLTAGGQIGVVGNSNAVYALTVWNGDLIVAGGFATAGGQTANGIARWDGSQWYTFQEAGGPFGVSGGGVRAVTVHNDDLIVGGTFTFAGGYVVNRIVRWDGAQWHHLVEPFGSSGVSGTVHALTVHNGDLIAGGQFDEAGANTVNRIVRWDGGQWHQFVSNGQIGVGPLSIGTAVRALTVYNDDLIIGGIFSTAGGQTVNRIARWRNCPGECALADLNCDGTVDVFDLLALLSAWGPCSEPENCAADLNGDSAVDVFDLLILLSEWG